MRVVMVTDDVRIDRRILAESESLARHGQEVIIVAGWGEGLPRHVWQGSVKIERFRPEDPGPVAEDYGFSAGEPFWLVPPRPDLVVGVRRSIGLMIRKSRALVIATTAIRRSFRRLADGISALCVRGVHAARHLRDAQASTRSTSASRPENSASIGSLSPAERMLVARLRYLDPDLIHAHDLPLLRVGVHVKRALGIPLIYDSHELYTEIATLAPRDKAMLSAREQALLPECDRVITVNPLVAQEMVHRYGIPAPLVIQNAVSAPGGFRATDAHDRFRQEFPIGKSDYIFLYQGWLAAHRGLQTLVQAMPRVPDNLHLVFLGYGNVQSDLRALAHRLGVSRRVHVKDAVSQDELFFWTASADVGLIPYRADLDLNTKYSSPNKLYEYIEAGLPMLGNDDLPFVRSIVTSNDFGRVAVLRTPDDFARAMTSMVGEGRAGLDRYRENILRRRAEFSWSVEEKILLQAYDALLGPPAAVCRSPGPPALADAGRC
jgi:glycosyltransferase involved in cell wall biosynthesis